MTVTPDLLDRVRDRLAERSAELTPHQVAQVLREEGRPVGDATVLAVHAALRRDVVGAGPLEPLLRTPGVTDVLVNGASQVFWDRGAGLEQADVTFPDEASLRRLAQRLAALGGRRLDDASPFVDLRLPDGTRFHAVLAPIATPGTVLSLRIPATRPFAMADLVATGFLDGRSAALLTDIVDARLAFLVSGGTGTGKTTLLRTLLGAVSETERLVVVEDAAELRPLHPHVVSLEARPPNIEGKGEVTLRTLVRQALRMRPDRLVVGEVRGGEVVDLLAALNTGHEGGCGTLHANASTEVPARVEALALAAGLGREAAHSQLAAAIDVVLHLARRSDGTRQLQSVAVPQVQPDGLVRMVVALLVSDDGVPRAGPGAGLLRDRLDR
ncbi:MAG: TadA family conjugal transfer-associated ATPase [Nocardioidaceae bacterium]